MALRTVKYDDRRNIVTAWSVERGRVGLIVPAGSSREAARRRALMMPLGLFEGEADIRHGFDLLNIRDVRPLAVLPAITASPSKSAVAMFLAEVLERCLRESPPDKALSEFIFSSVTALADMTPRGVANFPLVFLCRLAGLMGIEPDVAEWQPGRVLDLHDGTYRVSAPMHQRWIGPDEARVAAIIQRLSYATGQRLALPRDTRRKVLDALLDYFTLHLAPLDTLRTLPVVELIFA